MLTAVTGASGHIGGNLVRALLNEGRAVRALVREDRRALQGLDVELVEGDIFDRDSLRRLSSGAGTVFHLAGRISITGAEGGRADGNPGGSAQGTERGNRQSQRGDRAARGSATC